MPWVSFGSRSLSLYNPSNRCLPLQMPSLLAALALMLLLLYVDGNRFAAYDELGASQILPRNLPKFWPQQLQADATDNELAAGTSKMLNAFFGLTPTTTVRPTEAALNPYQLPPMYYNDFYEDLLTSKRNDVHAAGCDCKVMVSRAGTMRSHFFLTLISFIYI